MAGSEFGLVVTALDPFGNVDTNFSGNVAVALANNPGGATLGGTLTVTAQNGVATFSDLTLDQPGIGYTLQVSSNGLTSATTSAFNVQTSIAVGSGVGWGTRDPPRSRPPPTDCGCSRRPEHRLALAGDQPGADQPQPGRDAGCRRHHGSRLQRHQLRTGHALRLGDELHDHLRPADQRGRTG